MADGTRDERAQPQPLGWDSLKLVRFLGSCHRNKPQMTALLTERFTASMYLPSTSQLNALTLNAWLTICEMVAIGKDPRQRAQVGNLCLSLIPIAVISSFRHYPQPQFSL